jgi:hypothetical protein
MDNFTICTILAEQDHFCSPGVCTAEAGTYSFSSGHLFDVRLARTLHFIAYKVISGNETLHGVWVVLQEVWLRYYKKRFFVALNKKECSIVRREQNLADV